MVSGGIMLCRVVGPIDLRAWRYFEGAFPYTIEVNGSPWGLTFVELGKLTLAAGGIVAALTRPTGKRPTPGRRYHAETPGADGEPIELGIEAVGETDMFYFRFGDASVLYEIAEGRDLLRLFDILADDLAAIRRSSRSPLNNISLAPPPGERWRTWRPRFTPPDPDLDW